MVQGGRELKNEDALRYTVGTSDKSGNGAVAQLGERLNGIQEVVGSTPISSTIPHQSEIELPPSLAYLSTFFAIKSALRTI
jgi:hypothetical protein